MHGTFKTQAMPRFRFDRLVSTASCNRGSVAVIAEKEFVKDFVKEYQRENHVGYLGKRGKTHAGCCGSKTINATAVWIDSFR
jgi:hypothetical protein